MEYVHWLAQVNSALDRLTNRTLTAEDFDYRWLEAHLAGETPDQAAKAALARAGQATTPALQLRESARVSEAALDYLTRPTTRIEQYALSELSDTDLLALIIGGPYASANAGQLVEAISGNLKLLYSASLEELARNYAGVGYATAKRLKAALELGKRLMTPESRQQVVCPKDVFDYLAYHGLPLCEQEELWVLSLDTKNRVLGLSKVYRGNVNSSIIRTSEVLRDPVRYNAPAMIMAHNHPSGDPSPSPEDVHVTNAVRQAAQLLEIDLLDHLVVSPGAYVSLKERGLGFG